MGSKNKSGAFNNAEAANAAKTSAKEALAAAKEERKAFAKANGLSTKPENFSANEKHEKHGKKWAAMSKEIAKQEAIIASADAWLADNKPGKDGKKEKKGGGGAGKATKYTYPADCTTDADKKKFRAAQRAVANKAAKGEKPKKSAALAEEAKSKGKDGKKSKKDKKKNKAKKED